MNPGWRQIKHRSPLAGPFSPRVQALSARARFFYSINAAAHPRYAIAGLRCPAQHRTLPLGTSCGRAEDSVRAHRAL